VIVVIISFNVRDDWAFENAVIVDVFGFVNEMRIFENKWHSLWFDELEPLSLLTRSFSILIAFSIRSSFAYINARNTTLTVSQL